MVIKASVILFAGSPSGEPSLESHGNIGDIVRFESIDRLAIGDRGHSQDLGATPVDFGWSSEKLRGGKVRCGATQEPTGNLKCM